MGVAAIPYIVAGLSAAGSVYNTRQTQDQQNDIAMQGVQAQRANQREADAEIAEGIGKMGQSSPEEASKKATGEFLDQLRRSRSQAVGESQIGGEDFTRDLASAKDDVTQYGTRNADVMGRINAPFLQRQQEGVNMGRIASRLNTIGRNSNADQFLTQLRMGTVSRNPWIDAGAEIGGGVAGGLAGSGATSRPAAPQGRRYVAPTVDTRGFA